MFEKSYCLPSNSITISNKLIKRFYIAFQSIQHKTLYKKPPAYYY